MAQNKQSSALTAAKPFLYGGASGMFATTCIQPIDMIKVRIQLLGEGGVKSSANPFTVGAQIIKGEGFMSLYKGLSAGLLRQATYTTARMGIFRIMCDYFKAPDGSLSFAMKGFCGLAAGGLGASVGNPCDLALIRMQADATLPAAQRRNYTNVFNALARIAKEEGIMGWWKGCTPTVVRAMSLNMGMLASYDQTKEFLTEKIGKGSLTNFTSSAVAGFLASFMSLPFDFVKTRLQKQKPGPDGKLPYSSSIDCCLKVAKSEGPLAFYKGFFTYYVRIAPHAMITLLAMEGLQNMFGK